MRWLDLGLIHYAKAWELQTALHQEVAQGAEPVVLLCQHPKTITLGRSTQPQNLLLGREQYQAMGFEVFDIERGGDVTMHMPGQLVCYPIVPVGRRVRDYLRTLEDSVIELLSLYNLTAQPSPGYAGVWLGDSKICAFGVAIKRNVAMHGLALNVNNDLSLFNHIVACGLVGKGVTNLEQATGSIIQLDTVAEQFKPILEGKLSTFRYEPLGF